MVYQVPRIAEIWSRMGEHDVAMLGNPHAAEFGGEVVEAGDLDAGDIFEISGPVAVAADAVGDVADLARDVAELGHKTLP